MTWLIIALLVWLVGMPIAYNYTKKWDDKSSAEKIYFAVIWPLTLILYSVHLIHNNV